MLGIHGRTLRPRRKWSTAALLVLSLALTACSSSGLPASTYTTPPSDNQDALQTAASDISAAAAATATISLPDPPAAPASYHVAADIKDGGYSYSIDATLSLGTPTDGDSTQLPPGTDAVDLPLSGDVTISNTTPGRAAPGLENAKVQLFGLWRLPSVICPGEEHDLSGNLSLHYPVIGGESYCGIPLADAGVLGYHGPGDTGSGPLRPLYCLNYDTCPDYITYKWDHDRVSAVKAKLDKPDYVILGLEQTYTAKNSLGGKFCATSDYYILAVDPQLSLNRCR